ncbi:acyltransferase family protein [Lacticaseibacillus baoqingensis]|uniref:Acyltransferase family protein n=1 Tax=Lacticaseibacillus baoqingensis TaxID=2486013 RepID=A0ABW4E4Z1_9LACO|nr:acyltransferase family protein [Lacticaseibacillus baoqingensis]
MINTSSRNYGIDIARILSMFFVVLLHNLLQGGVLHSPELQGVNFAVAWFLENLAIIAVNLFAMITGFLSFGRSFHVTRIVSIIVQVLFWSWVILALLMLFKSNLALKDIIIGIIPVTLYWYINCYIGLMLLLPFCTEGIKSLSQHKFSLVLGSLLIISVTVGFIRHFSLDDGLSVFWLLILFFVGYYIRKFGLLERIHSTYFILVYFLLAMISLLVEILCKKYHINYDIMISANCKNKLATPWHDTVR